MGWWYAWPLAWLLGVVAMVMAPPAWSAADHAWRLWGAMVLAVLGGLLMWGARRWRRSHVACGGGAVLALFALAVALTDWRTAAQQRATWPADLGARSATAEVHIDSLPTPLPRGGWSLQAEVLAWPVAAVAKGDERAEGGEVGERPSGKRSARRWGQQPLSRDEAARLQSVQRVRLYWPEGDMPAPGSHWRVQARWHRPDGAANPGGMDAEQLAWVRGVGAVGQVDAATPQPGAPWWAVSRWALWDGWRAQVRARIATEVSDPIQAGVLAGLTVGDQSAIDDDAWEVFRRTGVAHLISISGSHIAVVGWWVGWLVRRHWGRSHTLAHRWPAPDAALVLSLAVCTAYAALAGWGLPAQRTVWTMAGLTALRLIGRDWPWTLSSLWVMAWVTLLDPWALVQAGFWLSFLCVTVLMTLGQDDPATSNVGPVRAWLKRVRQFGRVQLWLTLAMAPLALWCFQQVSVVGAVVNLVAIPVFDVLITPLALLGMVWPALWTLDAHLIDAALQGLQAASAWSGAVWARPVAPGWLQAWGVVVGLLMAWPGPRGWRLACVLALLPLLWLPPSWRLMPPPAHGQFQALAFDVGQGTAVLVRTRGHAMLFDTGGLIGPRDDAGKRHILPALQALGVNVLDALVLSHEDADHVGGAQRVLDGVRVTQVLGSLPPGHPLRTPTPAGAGQRPLPFGSCEAGLSWQWEGVRFDVLHPWPQRWAAEPNAHACVIRVQAAAERGRPGDSLLLTADIETAQEQALVAADGASQLDAPLRSTVLMAPHHGSATSSTSPFLMAVAPQLVVIQAGRRNRYGHPHPDVTARYDRLGLPWLSTVDCGAWWWDSASAASGSRPLGQCWREQSRRPWSGSPGPQP